jgi:hypothetical protein
MSNSSFIAFSSGKRSSNISNMTVASSSKEQAKRERASKMRKIYGEIFFSSFFSGEMSTMKLMNIHVCRNQTMEAQLEAGMRDGSERAEYPLPGASPTLETFPRVENLISS